jgi:hypothetical protein
VPRCSVHGLLVSRAKGGTAPCASAPPLLPRGSESGLAAGLHGACARREKQSANTGTAETATSFRSRPVRAGVSQPVALPERSASLKGSIDTRVDLAPRHVSGPYPADCRAMLASDAVMGVSLRRLLWGQKRGSLVTVPADVP